MIAAELRGERATVIALHRIALCAAVLFAGCLQSFTTPCETGGVCPQGLKCGRAGDTLICVPPSCGNGRLDPGEACDDGNNVSGDGCPADCSSLCGNRIVDPGEACDDGNQVGGDGCSADCLSSELCGNGVPDLGEQCDDGLLRYRCSGRCMLDATSWGSAAWLPLSGGAYMAYDAARGVAVLYTVRQGLDPAYVFVQTWEWDGIVWRQGEPVGDVPPVYFGQGGMAYDPGRRRVMMFGNFNPDYDPARHAWEWDGHRWSERMVPVTPPQLHDYAIASDAARRKIVLFGGATPGEAGGSGDVQDATWEWNGTTWQEVAPAARPPGRSAHAMTYDSARGKVVLYGGLSTEGQLLHDTWEYDGSTWTLRSTSGPPKSSYHQMVFDAARGKVVLFGGFGLQDDDVPVPGDTWEWDGTQWERRETVGPQARMWPAMTYDIVRREVLLFGGNGNGAHIAGSNATWTWDGERWIDRTAPVLPPGRSHHAMVYEASRAVAVMFGGRDRTGATLDDTWIWNGATWSRPPLTRAPPARADHAMAYDAARDRTVLFGGGDPGGSFGDTWEWDGTRWLERTSSVGPRARSGHAMVYDAARRRVLLLGGTAQGTLLADQWAWDGTGWEDVTPATLPPARSDFALAYDSRRDRVVLFGGRSGSRSLGDTWEWDGTRWLERPTVGGVFARFGHTMVYDPALHTVSLFGGHGDSYMLSYTWEWDGTSWMNVSRSLEGGTTEPPDVRHHHAMVYDTARGNLVLFGGSGPVERGEPTLGDLWFLRFGNPMIHDGACHTGFDSDGDGKIGCADPDCAGACASCGDGVCSAFESCRLCPADCGVCRTCGDLQCDPGETCSSCPGDCGECP